MYRLYKTGWTFYVDKHGILKEPKDRRPPWNKTDDNPNLVKTNDEDVYLIKRESDGVWFKASLKDWPEDFTYTYRCKNPDWIQALLTTSKQVILKTLSKREKKSLGL